MQYTGELGQYFRHQVRRRMMASVQPSRDASSNSSARANRGRRLSKVHRATEWLKPSFARSQIFTNFFPCRNVGQTQLFSCNRPAAEDPHLWAVAQSNLGIALQALGERETETAKLEEAVVAFRDSLKEIELTK